MPLFTFILDYDGGTYLSQVEAQSFESAPMAWAGALEPGTVRGMREASIQMLRASLTGQVPTQLDGLSQVWCVSALVRGRLALIHFVQTCHQNVTPNPSLK